MDDPRPTNVVPPGAAVAADRALNRMGLDGLARAHRMLLRLLASGSAVTLVQNRDASFSVVVLEKGHGVAVTPSKGKIRVKGKKCHYTKVDGSMDLAETLVGAGYMDVNRRHRYGR